MNDLRIGNKVFKDGELHEVTAHDFSRLSSLTPIPMKNGLFSENPNWIYIEPDKNKEEVAPRFERLLPTIKLKIVIFVGGITHIELTSYGNDPGTISIERNDLIYYHQLENFVYSISGQELPPIIL